MKDIKINDELHERLREISYFERISMTKKVNELLEKILDEEYPKEKPPKK
jgi:hypothetical protein